MGTGDRYTEKIVKRCRIQIWNKIMIMRLDTILGARDRYRARH